MMMRRRVFYSYDEVEDNFRAENVRTFAALEGNSPASFSALKAFEEGGDEAVMHWINNQMNGRQCTIVLIGPTTARHGWTYYEIVKAWNEGMGVVGLFIHGLKNARGSFSAKGTNPFDHVTFEENGATLSSVAKCYDPTAKDQKTSFDWIAKNLHLAVEEAIRIRGQHQYEKIIYQP